MRTKMKDGSYKYFLRVEKQLVEVSEEVHKAYYSENWKRVYSFMHTHGFCRCNYGYFCEGDCNFCPYVQETEYLWKKCLTAEQSKLTKK